MDNQNQFGVETPDTPLEAVVVHEQHKRWPVLAVLLGLACIVGAYVYAHGPVATAQQRQAELQGQLSSVQSQLDKQQAINTGTASAELPADPTGQLALDSGYITMPLPKELQRADASRCPGGANRDSMVLCHDITGLTDASKKFTATVSVYDYQAKDGTAKQWVEQRYAEPLANLLQPTATVVSTDKVNGDSAIFYTLASGSASVPNHVDGTWVVVHKNRAVVIASSLQDDGTADGKQAYDYRQNYQPLLQQMINGIAFRD